MVQRLQGLPVHFLLKVPDQAWVRRALGPYRQSEKDPTLWTAHGELYGARLCSVQQRLPLRTAMQVQQALGLDDYLVPDHGTAHVLTNLPGIHALTAWRGYNAGAVVEQRLKECYQLGFGKTAIDDRAGNARQTLRRRPTWPRINSPTPAAGWSTSRAPRRTRWRRRTPPLGMRRPRIGRLGTMVAAGCRPSCRWTQP
jgi:hypothetical protein